MTQVTKVQDQLFAFQFAEPEPTDSPTIEKAYATLQASVSEHNGEVTRNDEIANVSVFDQSFTLPHGFGAIVELSVSNGTSVKVMPAESIALAYVVKEPEDFGALLDKVDKLQTTVNKLLREYTDNPEQE